MFGWFHYLVNYTKTTLASLRSAVSSLVQDYYNKGSVRVISLLLPLLKVLAVLLVWLVALLWMAVVSLAGLSYIYSVYIPHMQHVVPVQWDMSSHKDWQPIRLSSPPFRGPQAFVELRQPNWYLSGGGLELAMGKEWRAQYNPQLLDPSQVYDISLHLEMPESERNNHIGMVNVYSEIYCDVTVRHGVHSHTVYSASSPNTDSETETKRQTGNERSPILVGSSVVTFLPPYLSPLVRIIKSLTFVVPNIFGYSQEYNQISLDIFQNYREDSMCKTDFVRFVLPESAQTMEISQAYVLFEAQLRGFQYILYHWRLPSSFIVFCVLFTVQCSLALLVVGVGVYLIFFARAGYASSSSYEDRFPNRYSPYDDADRRNDNHDSSHTTSLNTRKTSYDVLHTMVPLSQGNRARVDSDSIDSETKASQSTALDSQSSHSHSTEDWGDTDMSSVDGQLNSPRDMDSHTPTTGTTTDNESPNTTDNESHTPRIHPTNQDNVFISEIKQRKSTTE